MPKFTRIRPYRTKGGVFPEVRLWTGIDQRGVKECWPWLRACDPSGYGIMSWFGERELVHRIIWTLANGAIPAGMQVDHNCHNLDPLCGGGACVHRRCANLRHLRLLTLRGNIEASPRAKGTKLTCPQGHAYDRISKRGYRACRTCERANCLRFRAKGLA